MNVYIIEDSNFFRKFVGGVIREIETEEDYQLNVLMPENLRFFIDHLNKTNIEHRMEIYFMDINLTNNFTGIDLSEIIRIKRPLAKIIFFTSFEDQAIDIINRKIFADGYIIKNIDPIKNTNAIKKSVEKVLNSIKTERHKLTVKQGANDISFFENEIITIQVSRFGRNLLDLKTISGEYTVNGTLGKLAKNLKNKSMFKGLKSYIINIDYVKVLNHSELYIEFKDHSKLYVSGRILNKVRTFMENV